MSNLPTHLQEKMKNGSLESSRSLIGKIVTTNVWEFELHKRGFEVGYQQAYSDILQELGPVFNALNFYGDERRWHKSKATIDPKKHLIFADKHNDKTGECEPVELDKPFEQTRYEASWRIRVDQGSKAREALKHLKERILNE